MADLLVSQPLRITLDRRRADDWALALASAGIDSRLDQSSNGYTVIVRESDWSRANAVVAAFEAENPPRPMPAASPGIEQTSYGAAVVAVLLCAFFVVTGPRGGEPYWFERGAAVASRIAAGEIWRTVTALTLHADFPHILTNAATLVLFGTSLCGLIGAGSAVWLMLISGAAGNWLTAALHGAPHSAVGASTGIFGGIGGLAALELMRRRRGAAVSAWRAWAPIAAGLALLGFLGTSPQSDVLAHLFGFAVGALLGVSAFELQSLRDRRGLQLALCAGAALTVAACWWLALA
jgi:membrane associated rhomboid family serine protease